MPEVSQHASYLSIHHGTHSTADPSWSPGVSQPLTPPLPLLPTNPQSHRQARNHLPLLLPPPLCPPQQPIRQGDNSRSLVRPVTFIRMLDRMGGDTALGIKGEDEQTGEFIALGEVEDRLGAT